MRDQREELLRTVAEQLAKDASLQDIQSALDHFFREPDTKGSSKASTEVMSPLVVACDRGNLHLLRYLAAQSETHHNLVGDPLLSPPDKYGNTCTHHAVSGGQPQVTLPLLVNILMQSPSHSLSKCESLLQLGQVKNNNGDTPLMMAVVRPSLPFLQTWTEMAKEATIQEADKQKKLQRIADILCTENHSHANCLTLSITMGHVAITEYLFAQLATLPRSVMDVRCLDTYHKSFARTKNGLFQQNFSGERLLVVQGLLARIEGGIRKLQDYLDRQAEEIARELVLLDEEEKTKSTSNSSSTSTKKRRKKKGNKHHSSTRANSARGTSSDAEVRELATAEMLSPARTEAPVTAAPNAADDQTADATDEGTQSQSVSEDSDVGADAATSQLGATLQPQHHGDCVETNDADVILSLGKQLEGSGNATVQDTAVASIKDTTHHVTSTGTSDQDSASPSALEAHGAPQEADSPLDDDPFMSEGVNESETDPPTLPMITTDVMMRQRLRYLSRNRSKSGDDTNSLLSEEVDAMLQALCLDVSMLLYTPHGMALNLSPSQLDAVQDVLEKQMKAVREARTIQSLGMEPMTNW